MNARSTTLVVPAFNEAARLDTDAFREGLRRDPDLRLLFVDDGSTDATLELLRAFADEWDGRADVLSLAANHGKAEAVRHGLRAAAADEVAFIGFADADLSAPLDEVARLRAALLSDPDLWLAMGARILMLGRTIERSPWRHYLGRVFATGASLTLGLGVYDTQCGLKLFRNSPAVASLLDEPFLSRWIFDVELIARLVHAPGEPGPLRRVREVPLERWCAADGTRLKLSDFLRAPRELLAIRRRYPTKSLVPKKSDPS
jgi:glycosyltransferase involved in cell wall biosynthesis